MASPVVLDSVSTSLDDLATRVARGSAWSAAAEGLETCFGAGCCAIATRALPGAAPTHIFLARGRMYFRVLLVEQPREASLMQIWRVKVYSMS